MATISPSATPDTAAVSSSKHERKSKKEKKADKKRPREEDGVDGERRHKKSKSVTETTLEIRPAVEAVNEDGEGKKKKKKDKKSKHSDNATEPSEDVTAADQVKAEKKKHKKKHRETNSDTALPEGDDETEKAAEEQPKKPKKKRDTVETSDEVADKAERKKKKKSKKHHEDEANSEAQLHAPSPEAAEDADSMDVDTAVAEPAKSSKSKIHQPPDIPANPQFPFFTQTVSLYEPLYPVGWAAPVTNCQYQHLKHLQNRYVPSLRGVLMDYKNVSFGENAGRAGAATTDDEPCAVLSQKEFAVGFGWITADVDLFVPSRGAWMEGSVNLQTEGHIGVVCFGKFNASIEARRLPADWRWVPSDASDAQSAGGFDETASLLTADDHGVVRQVHSTGFWADAAGDKVRGRIRFRIRNFDVGTSGETSYLSLEGTMLDRAGEKRLVAEEARAAKSRKEGKGGAKRERRRAPDFSMTRFEDEAEAAEPVQDTEEGKLEEWKEEQPEEPAEAVEEE